MKTQLINRTLALAVVTAVLLSGCSRRDESSVGTPGNPLVVVVSPAHMPAGSSNALAFIKQHLEEATAMSVDVKTAASPSAAVQEFSAGRTDAGIVTLEEYLVAREEYGVHADLQVLRGDKLNEYEGVLLARAAGGVRNTAELEGKKVGFVGPYSFSGFTLPCIYLKKSGVKVTPDFAASHGENLNKLLKGEIHAAATYARQALRSPGLIVLAVTGKAPNEPVVVRKDLSPEKRALLLSAFLSLNATAEGRKALSALADITGFTPVDESVYRPLHELLRAESKTVYELVPGGWNIYRLNQPYMPD